MGDNLNKLVKYAKKWFEENNINVPKLAKDWQTSSVRRGEIPPGCSGQKLRKLGITQKKFITLINGNKYIESHINSPITKNNIEDILGFIHLKDKVINKHKKVLIKCKKCNYVEWLAYSTLQRMRKTNNKYCRICRNAGGKRKDISEYNRFGDFTAVSIDDDSIISYKCKKCSNIIKRGMGYAKTTEYLVCEKCNPTIMMGTKFRTEIGDFDSKMEYLSYLKLIEILPEKYIIRQKSYNELFNTGTKHTADFYVPKLNLVLEVTTTRNNLSNKYYETMLWKLSIDPSVKFAYSIKEVEDIVRAMLKNVE